MLSLYQHMNIHSYVDICILFFKELKANVYKEESIAFHYEIKECTSYYERFK